MTNNNEDNLELRCMHVGTPKPQGSKLPFNCEPCKGYVFSCAGYTAFEDEAHNVYNTDTVRVPLTGKKLPRAAYPKDQ